MPMITDATRTGLLFRRQFILSGHESHMLEGSIKHVIGGRYHLCTHPDLETTHVVRDGKSLTLLGFMLDPDHPEASNEDILHRLFSEDDVMGNIDSLGGRWVLIVHNEAETIVLHDATAQRQVHFTTCHAAGSLVCASEPGLIAENLGLTMDPVAVDFIKSRQKDDFEIYWMPGDTSLFSEIRALLPNHSLSLITGETRRYWPVRPPQAQDAFEECVHLLDGQLRSAAHRFPLSVPMTAGWDSRLMLALCREHADDLHAFTLDYPNLLPGSRDIAVPAKLLDKLGIPHHVVGYPQTIDGEIRETFRRNNVSANDAYCADVQALLEVYPQDRVCVTGDAAEIVKCYYERKRSGPITPEELADFSRLGRHPFAVAAFASWLNAVGEPAIGLLDLFCWEQMVGRWQAKVRSEFDMVQESFSPLNNRRLLSLMLGMPSETRRAPDYVLFARLIREFWPDVMTEPINPPEKTSPSRRIINAVKKTGVMQLIPENTKRKVKALFH